MNASPKKSFVRCVRLRNVCGLALALSISSSAWSQSARDLLPDTKPPVDQSVVANPTVGSIRAVTGLISLKSAQGKIRFASTGTQLFVGDVINTEKKSTAVLEFVDTTQIALRPETRFVVENYTYKLEEPVADRAEFKLVKGGLRTLTGLIGKRGNADSFAMKSQTATIGIRGTDFTARICQADECRKTLKTETASALENNASNADVAGRVSQLMGTSLAVTPQGVERTLSKSSAVFSGEVLRVSSGGFVVLSMADATRLTLPGGSVLEVQAYRFVPSSVATSVAAFKLLKGAVRAVTGNIAKVQPNNVKFFTDTATVGIRGTGFDLACTTSVNEVTQLATCAVGSNLNVDMRIGQVEITNGAGSLLVNAGQSAVVPSGNQRPALGNSTAPVLDAVPDAGPLPENTPANFELLSSTPVADLSASANPDEGQLFVSVNEGTVVLSNGDRAPLLVNRGEGAVVNTGSDLPPLLLVAPPEVLSRDITLAAPPFTAPQCAP